MPLILFWKLWTSSWRPWINLDYILKVLDLGDVCSVLSLHVIRTIWQLHAPSFTKTFCSSPSMEFHAKICLTLLFYVEPSMTIFAVHAYQPSPNNNPSVNTALWGVLNVEYFFICFVGAFAQVQKASLPHFHIYHGRCF